MVTREVSSYRKTIHTRVASTSLRRSLKKRFDRAKKSIELQLNVYDVILVAMEAKLCHAESRDREMIWAERLISRDAISLPYKLPVFCALNAILIAWRLTSLLYQTQQRQSSDELPVQSAKSLNHVKKNRRLSSTCFVSKSLTFDWSILNPIK